MQLGYWRRALVLGLGLFFGTPAWGWGGLPWYGGGWPGTGWGGVPGWGWPGTGWGGYGLPAAGWPARFPGSLGTRGWEGRTSPWDYWRMTPTSLDYVRLPQAGGASGFFHGQLAPNGDFYLVMVARGNIYDSMLTAARYYERYANVWY